MPLAQLLRPDLFPSLRLIDPMVDGRMIVENGRYKLASEADIVARGAKAVYKLWKMGEAGGVIERGAVTA